MNPTAPRLRPLPTLALLSLCAIAWGTGLRHGLQGDDGVVLDAFMRVRDDLPGLHRYFLAPSWGIFYRPLTVYLYDRLFALCWPATWPMHLLALVVHMMGAWAVVRVARACGARANIAWLAGAIFVTLPAHAEPVLWIAALHGMLENVLGLWAVVFLVEGRRGAWRPWRVAGGVACFLLAILTKESGLVVIGVIGLHDLLWRRELHERARRPAALAAMYLPMFAGVVGVLVMRRTAYGGFTLFTENTLDLGYLSIAVVRGIVGCFSPLPWRTVESVLTPATRTAVAVPVLLLLPVAVAATFAARGARSATWLWLCLWGVLTPLAWVGVVPAERHLYLASAFAAVLLALLVQHLHGTSPRRARSAALAVSLWLAVQLGVSYQRTGAWGTAARHVGAVLGQTERLLPGLEPDALLLYLGVPDEVDGALVFRFGDLGKFMHARYGSDAMQAHMLCTPAELPAGLLDAPGVLQFTIRARGGHLYWPDALHGGAYADHDARLMRNARLGQSFLILDWLNAGKPVTLLLYDATSRTLQVAPDDLRSEVADRLFTFVHAGAPRLPGARF